MQVATITIPPEYFVYFDLPNKDEPVMPRKANNPNPTRRERQIAGHIYFGLTNRQIAELLHISVRTVESHRANLMSKLQIKGRSELFRVIREQGLAI